MKAVAVDSTRSTQAPECSTETDIEPPLLEQEIWWCMYEQ